MKRPIIKLTFHYFEQFFDPTFLFKYPILGRTVTGSFQFVVDLFMGKIVLDTQVLKDYIYRFTGDHTFKEVFQNYGWNLNITVTDYSMQHAPHLLNYLTTPNVLIWSAVLASCAIPGMYAKVELM